MDDLIASAWQAEEELLSTNVRSNPARLVALLAPDFYEIGQSGRRWSRDEILSSVPNETASSSDVTCDDQEATLISATTVLLSYRLTFRSRTSRRSALWRWDGTSLRCFFHQGTPLPVD